MKLLRIIIAIAVLFSFSSCALMFNGTQKSVSIKSMTPDAKIYVDGELVGTDAASVRLKRSDNHVITIKKDGCETITKNVNSHVQGGWVMFDLLFNWFAFLTDAPTGAWKTFDNSNFTVELSCPNNK